MITLTEFREFLMSPLGKLFFPNLDRDPILGELEDHLEKGESLEALITICSEAYWAGYDDCERNRKQKGCDPKPCFKNIHPVLTGPPIVSC
jgi:hypothetical protein